MAEPAAAEVDALPPTQYLVVEVLAARSRLGEPFWTFPSRLGAAIKALEGAGLVRSGSAPTPGHVRVWLTDVGRAAATDAGYTSPLANALAPLLAESRFLEEAAVSHSSGCDCAHAGCLAREVRELLDKISGDGGGEG